MKNDHESQVGELEGQKADFMDLCVAGICFSVGVAWVTLARWTRWFRVKRVCSWCNPKRWIGGNPFAKAVTHGMCNRCFKRQMAALGVRRAKP